MIIKSIIIKNMINFRKGESRSLFLHKLRLRSLGDNVINPKSLLTLRHGNNKNDDWFLPEMELHVFTKFIKTSRNR